MATRNNIKERSTPKVRRERAAVPWRHFVMSVSCGLVLAIGFFYAAKQHFATVDYSMRNSDMRKSKEKLEGEQRKLKVEREAVSAPATIEKAGMKMGLIKFTSQDFKYIDPNGNVTTPVVAKNSSDAGKSADKKKIDTVASANTGSNIGPNGVTKTVDVKPIKRAGTEKRSQPVRDNRNDIAKVTGKEIRTAIARK